MSSRCTVWIRVKTEHAKRARAIWEQEDYTPYEEDTQSDGGTEFMFEEIRDPDDLTNLLDVGGIPWHKVCGDDGEGNASREVNLRGRKEYVPMLDSSIIVFIDETTGLPEERALERVRAFLALEKEFDRCLKE